VNQWQLYIMDSLKFKAWVNAARLRTLPLALSSSLMGSFAAYQDGRFKWNVFGLALLTTLFLQILSNLANDYGDSVNGADNAERVGPARAVQSGKISAYDMKRAVVITSVLAFISGILLIGAGVGYSNWLPWVVFLMVGLLAISAAILIYSRVKSLWLQRFWRLVCIPVFWDNCRGRNLLSAHRKFTGSCSTACRYHRLSEYRRIKPEQYAGC
jgi:hypothetical protein